MRQYKTLMLIIFFICVFCFGVVNAKIRGYDLVGKSICLDAGHGGVDAGAISSNVLEKDMNLELTSKLAVNFFNRGAMVFLTRDGDYDLAEGEINRKRNDLYQRARFINSAGCDVYISMHLNASPSSKWHGIQVFYSNVVKDNKLLADSVTKKLSSNMSNVRDYKQENGYYMYSKIKVPGILVEAGFISNSQDNYKIRQSKYQDILTNNIVDGVVDYFNK